MNNGTNTDETLEKDKKNTGMDSLQFKKDFISDSLRLKESTEKNIFIHDIMTKDKLSSAPDVENELKKYKAVNGEKYSDIDIEKISIEDLRRLVAADFLKLSNSRENLKEKVISDYDITQKEYDKKISKKIDKIGVDKLNELLKSDKKLSDFFIKELKIELSKKDKFKILESIGPKDVEKRLDKLDDIGKKEVTEILEKCFYSNSVSDSDIRILFSYDFFTKKEKAEFIQNYIPFITLDKAVEIGLLTQADAKNKKKEINKKLLKDEGLSQDDVDKLTDYVSLGDIKISTKDINDESLFNELSEKVGFKNFENDLKSLSDDARNEILEKGPVSLYQLSEALKSLDKIGTKFQNLEKFKTGNYIGVSTKDSENKIITNYVKIVSDNEQDKKFNFTLVGGNEGGIDIKGIGKPDEKYYSDFLGGFKESDASLNFFTKKEMENKIESGELESTNLDLVTSSELVNNPEKKKVIEEKYINKLNDEIQYLETKISTGDKNISQNDLQNKRDKLNELESGNATLDSLSMFENLDNLISKLDMEDSDGKNIISDNGTKGIFKGIILKTDEGGFYEIYWINKDYGTINIKVPGTNKYNQELSYSDFFKNFKDNKTKRVAPIKDLGDLKEKGSKENTLGWGDFKDNWLDHDFKDGKIVAKNVDDGDDTGDREVEYLISDSSNEILKICSTEGGMVEVITGNRKNLSDMTEDDAKKLGGKSKNTYGSFQEEILYISSESVKIPISELDEYIKKYSLYPSWQTGKTVKAKSQKGLDNEFKGKFWSKVFSNYSVSEIIQGGTMFIESFRETLKKGNEIHSAKTALKLGHFLPDDLRQDLKIKVENAEKEEMDKEIEDLGKVDSPIAITRILGWLKNKDVAEHKKEAAMLFMLEKYGHLSAKTEKLYGFRGKWLWYEAFGGRINDKFFLEQQKRCKETGVSFSEEFLMLHLLKQQCKLKGYNGVFRRTRLHKEFEYKWSQGVEDEFNKGYGDAEKKRTHTEMVYEGMLEAVSGTTSNSVGWFKKAIERGGTLENMSEGFFCLLYAGVFNNIDQKTFLKIKSLWDDGLGIVLTRFASSNAEAGIFNETVLKLSKKIDGMYGGKFKGIGAEADKIFKDANSGKGNEGKRLEETQRFWHKYNKVLVRALNMVNTTDSTYAESDNIIFLEKDNEEIFNKYYNTVRKYSTEEDAFNSKVMNDGQKGTGITGLNVHELSKRYLGMHTSQNFRDSITGPNIFNEISGDIKSINKKTFIGGDDEASKLLDRKAKEKYLLQILKDMISGFMIPTAGTLLRLYNDNSLDIGKFFNSINLNIVSIAKNYPSSDIANDKANHLLMKAVNNILDGALDGNENNFVNPLTGITETTQSDAQGILNPMSK